MNNTDKEFTRKVKNFIVSQNHSLGLAVLGAYFSKQPIAAGTMRKGGVEWDFVDDHRRLTHLVYAIIENLIETDEDFSQSTIVQKAKEASAPKPEENTGDKAARLFRESIRDELLETQPYHHDWFVNLWQAFFLRDGREVYLSMSGISHSTLDEQPTVVEEMQKLVDEGLAPTPQQVGLASNSEPAYTLSIKFSNRKDADAFLARWKNWLGDKVANAKQRLAA